MARHGRETERLCSLRRDFVTAISRMRLNGPFQNGDLPAITTALSRGLFDDPVALVVDLTAARAAGWRAISALADAGRLALVNGDTPILVCADHASTTTGDHIPAEIPIYRTMLEAGAAARALPPRETRRHWRLPPHPQSVTVTRHMVGVACNEWRMPTLAEPARAIVSELAGNAVVHAATEFDVTLSLTANRLRISVRDRSTMLPHRGGDPGQTLTEGGRGLTITSALSTTWGALPAADGKTVWAYVRA